MQSPAGLTEFGRLCCCLTTGVVRVSEPDKRANSWPNVDRALAFPVQMAPTVSRTKNPSQTRRTAMKTIDINSLETVTGGTAAAYRRLATLAIDGVKEGVKVGVNLTKGGGYIKFVNGGTFKPGTTLNISDVARGAWAR